MGKKMENWFLDESWGKVDTLVVYGFGRVAKAYLELLRKDFTIAYIIDNSVGENRENYDGIPRVSYQAYKQENTSDDKIVVAATGRAWNSIRKSLEEDEKREYYDYTDIKSFLGEWYLRFRNRLNIGRVAHSVTQRCTFRCRDCQLLMPYIKNPQDDSLEMLQGDLDALFSLADYVADFDVMGGETFLYPYLKEYLQYMTSGYKSRIGNIQIVTNGSRIPKEEELSLIQKENIHIRISDYTNEIPYKKKLQEFIDKLEEWNITYFRFPEMEWSPFGYPYQEACVEDTKEALAEHMKSCGGGMSHSLHNAKLYFCNTAGGVCENMDYQMPEEDYIDLKKTATDPDGKKKLWLYSMGIMKNGGMSLCRYCNGYDSAEAVPAGVQL